MAGILGFGGYVPERVMTNDDWSKLVDTTDEWITARTGIKRRRFAAEGQKAVIVGGGYIGVEVAAVLRQMGLEVYVVEMLPQILMATTEPEFITDVEKTLTE